MTVYNCCAVMSIEKRVDYYDTLINENTEILEIRKEIGNTIERHIDSLKCQNACPEVIKSLEDLDDKIFVLERNIIDAIAQAYTATDEIECAVLLGMICASCTDHE